MRKFVPSVVSRWQFQIAFVFNNAIVLMDNTDFIATEWQLPTAGQICISATFPAFPRTSNHIVPSKCLCVALDLWYIQLFSHWIIIVKRCLMIWSHSTPNVSILVMNKISQTEWKQTYWWSWISLKNWYDSIRIYIEAEALRETERYLSDKVS